MKSWGYQRLVENGFQQCWRHVKKPPDSIAVRRTWRFSVKSKIICFFGDWKRDVGLPQRSWVQSGVNAMKALKTEKHAGKFLPTVFWRCWRTFASGIHATQDSYNRRELCQHDDSFAGVNRRENTSQQACSFFTTVRASVDRSRQSQTAIRECGFQQLRYPPYSPHMAPSNYFLSRVLKKSWRARHFSSDEDLKAVVLPINLRVAHKISFFPWVEVIAGKMDVV